MKNLIFILLISFKFTVISQTNLNPYTYELILEKYKDIDTVKIYSQYFRDNRSTSIVLSDLYVYRNGKLTEHHFTTNRIDSIFSTKIYEIDSVGNEIEKLEKSENKSFGLPSTSYPLTPLKTNIKYTKFGQISSVKSWYKEKEIRIALYKYNDQQKIIQIECFNNKNLSKILTFEYNKTPLNRL